MRSAPPAGRRGDAVRTAIQASVGYVPRGRTESSGQINSGNAPGEPTFTDSLRWKTLSCDPGPNAGEGVNLTSTGRTRRGNFLLPRMDISARRTCRWRGTALR